MGDSEKSSVKLPVDHGRVPPVISPSQKVIIIRGGEGGGGGGHVYFARSKMQSAVRNHHLTVFLEFVQCNNYAASESLVGHVLIVTVLLCAIL